MKKFILFTICIACIRLQAQNNYKPEELKGFDGKAAWEKAKHKSQKPFEQKEYYSALEKQYVQNKNETQVVNSNLPYSISNTSANKTVINLSPYSSYCPNADFSSTNFSNWTGGTYSNPASTNWNTFTPTWVSGIVTNGVNNPAQPYSSFVTPTIRQEILTIPPTINNPPVNYIGWDSIAIKYPNHISDIPFVPPTGGGVTCRLGNAQANINNETEELSYVVNVSSQNSRFTYAYAVVIFDGGHAVGDQPFFKISITDQSGNPISGCGTYQIDASTVSTDTSFHRASQWNSANSPPSWTDGYTAPGVTDPNWFYDVYYKPWATEGVDLTPYIGQNVTITFQTADCVFGGHWCYAYIDASCSASQMQVSMCSSVSTQQIIGPPGYATYQWYGPNSPTITIAAPQGTNDTLVIQNGNIGDVYYLKAVAANGCVINLNTTLQNSQIGVAYTNSTPSCPGGNSGTVNVVPIGNPSGNYTFNWVNSTGQNVGSTQQITGLTPGTYSVHIASTNISCGGFDTTVTVNIAPPVTFSQTKNFCGNAAYLTTPLGSTNIQWYGISGALIPAPQGTNDTLLATGTVNNEIYTVTYINNGCRDSTLITLTHAYIGNLNHTGIQNVCSGATNGQATINLTTTISPPYNYTITASNNYINHQTNSNNTSINLTGLSYGTYSVLCSDSSCLYNDNFKIDTIKMPTVTVLPNVVCSNTSALITFSGGQNNACQLSNVPCLNPLQFTCGPSNTVTPNSFSYPTPYGNYYTKMRAQYIYTAAELNTAGINAGNISSIAFDVTNLNTSITSYPNFNISVGCSGQSSFTSTSDQNSFITGLTSVYNNASVNVTTGLNTYNFTQPYTWDGTSNLIVDVCFEVPGTFSYTANAQVNCTSTSNYSSLTITSDTDPTCNISTTGAYGAYPEQMRPVATFGWCGAATNASMYSFNLNPNTGIVPAGSGVTAPTTSLQPASTTHYTLTTTSNSGGCIKKDTFTVFINSASVTIPTITQNGMVLSSTLASNYQWYLNGAAIPGATLQQDSALQSGNYTACVTYANGCGACSNSIAVNNVGISSIVNADETITIYPNPALDNITVKSTKEISSIKIISTLGQEIYIDKNLRKEINIDISNFAKGVYFMEVQILNSSKIIKFIKN